jgi:hypothetical protein
VAQAALRTGPNAAQSAGRINERWLADDSDQANETERKMHNGLLARTSISCSLVPRRVARAGAALALLAATTVVSDVQYVAAESLQIQQIKEREQRYLHESAKSPREYCHATFAAKFDWAGAQEADLKKYNIGAYCNSALSGVSGACHEQIGKDAVQKQIKAIVCSFGPERSVSLENGTLNYQINFQSPRDSQFVSDYLLNHLRADGAQGDTVNIKHYKEYQEKEIIKDVDEFNRLCRSNIPVNFDWSYLPTYFGEGGTGTLSVMSDCKSTLMELKAICRDPVGESAVKRQITSISCGFALDPSFILKDGVLKNRMGHGGDLLNGRDSIEKAPQCFPSNRLCYLRGTLRVDGSNGDSLKLHDMKLGQEKDLAGDIKELNKTCESNIDVKLDWTAVPAEWSEKPNYSSSAKPRYHCRSALGGIEGICLRNALGRSAVQQQVKSVTCGFGAEPSILLKDGALEIKMNFDEDPDGDFVAQYLHDHL